MHGARADADISVLRTSSVWHEHVAMHEFVAESLDTAVSGQNKVTHDHTGHRFERQSRSEDAAIDQSTLPPKRVVPHDGLVATGS